MGLFRILGVDRASALGGFIGRNLLARTRVTRRARDNLAAAYPEMSASEIDAIITEMWDNLGRTVAEYAHLDAFRMTGDDPRIEVTGLDHVEARACERQGDHLPFRPFRQLGNHADHGRRLRRSKAALSIVRSTIPMSTAGWSRQRTRNGPAEMISKGAQGTRRIFTLLRGGKSIFILVDQKTNEGIPVPFFGRVAMTTPAPAVLALKLGAVLLPVSNERVGGARFRVTVHQPIEVMPTRRSRPRCAAR